MEDVLKNQTVIEHGLLADAITAFRKTVDLEIVAQPYPFQAEAQPDALIRITRQDKVWDFAAKVKTDAQLTAPVKQLDGIARYPYTPIIVTHYVNPNAAKRLRAAHVPFIDTAGNAYIEEHGLFVFVTGNRPARDEPQQNRTLRLNAAALRVVFHLLCCEADLNTNYRDLAQKTHTALGTLTNYFKLLRENNYILGQGPNRRLVNQGAMLREWVNAYPKRLRPKLLRGRFRAHNLDWWKTQHLHQYDAYWGGEVAAARLTEFLRPATLTIYTHGKPTDLIAAFGLTKDPHGPIELLDAFWHQQEGMTLPDLNVVHPILIYADLAALQDERADQAATQILGRYLARFAE